MDKFHVYANDTGSRRLFSGRARLREGQSGARGENSQCSMDRAEMHSVSDSGLNRTLKQALGVQETAWSRRGLRLRKQMRPLTEAASAIPIGFI